MSRLMQMAADKAHERTITIATYPAGDDKVIVEGRLVDRRLKDYYLVTGEKRPAGDIHHMIIRLLVEIAGFTIEDVEVELAAVPRDECNDVLETLDVIKGEKITKGFSARMKSLLGGTKSCTHLLTLLIAMGPAALQGVFSSRAQKPMEMASFISDPGRARFFMKTLLNTCYVWREDGPAMKKLKDTIEAVRGKES
ncbi:MAG TPA: DUF2889 domain-containing protein [Spirochaetota bacterium]|nr:DUF2889 domain-containing protein [Spirochaetota bacterium]